MSAASVLAASALAWSPAKAAFKQAHARKLTAEAEAYLAQNRPDSALASAMAALQNGAANARALRVLLELHARSGNPDAIRAWAALAKCANLTSEDRRQLMRWAVIWGRADLAHAQWTELSRERPLAPETARVAAGFFELRGEPRLAVEMARRAIETDQGDVESRMILGRVLLTHGSETDLDIGKRLLMEASERNDALGLTVLRHLAFSGKLSPWEAQQCLSKLQRHPLRHADDELAAADLKVRITPYRRERILRETSETVLAKKGSAAPLARWLLQHGAFEEVLRAATLERAAESKELALLRCDAMAQLGQWPAIERELALHEAILPAFERELFRARAAAGMNRERLADLHWKQAEQLAGRNAEKVILMARYAAGAGAWEAAQTALQGLEPKSARAGWEQLLLLSLADKKIGAADKARELLTAMRNLYPDDNAVENDLAYLNLLLGRDFDGSLRRAEELHRAQPEGWTFRATVALGRLRNGLPHEALELLESVELDWRLVSAGHRALYAAALAQAGRVEKAARIRASFSMQDVLPEEASLMQAAPSHSSL